MAFNYLLHRYIPFCQSVSHNVSGSSYLHEVLVILNMIKKMVLGHAALDFLVKVGIPLFPLHSV